MFRKPGALRNIVLAVCLLWAVVFAVGGAVVWFRSGPPPGTAATENHASGTPTDDQRCVSAAQTTLSTYLGDETPATGAKIAFVFNHNGEQALDEWSKGDSFKCLQSPRKAFFSQLSAQKLTINDRLAQAYSKGLITQLQNGNGEWTIPEHPVPPANLPSPPVGTLPVPAASAPPPAGEGGVKPAASAAAPTTTPTPTPPDDPCIAKAETDLVKSNLQISATSKTAVGWKGNKVTQGEPATYEVLNKYEKCLAEHRPEFWKIVKGTSSVKLKERLNSAHEAHLLEAGPESTVLLPASSHVPAGTAELACAKPGSCPKSESGNTGTSIAPAKTPAAKPTPTELAPLLAKLDGMDKRLTTMSVKLDQVSRSAIPRIAVFLLIILLGLILVVLFVHLLSGLAGGPGRTPGSPRWGFFNQFSGHTARTQATTDGDRQMLSAQSQTELLTQLLRLTGEVKSSLARQEEALARQETILLRFLESRQDYPSQSHGATGASSSNHSPGEGGASQNSAGNAQGWSQTGKTLVLGNDALADYSRLASAFFSPSTQREQFERRWAPRAVNQVTENGQFVLRSSGIDDEAMLWVLVNAEDRGRYPVVLAPTAYDNRMTENSGRPLYSATHAFFTMPGQTGAPAKVVEPAWVQRDGSVYVCLEKGVLSA
ncbi:MAG TPA: hypothetical protein VGG99_10570 [Acetobacteraceae bacterium]|jgi:hypothetical protein